MKVLATAIAHVRRPTSYVKRFAGVQMTVLGSSPDAVAMELGFFAFQTPVSASP